MKWFFVSLLAVFIQMIIASSLDNGARCPPVLFPNGKVRTRGRGKIIRFSCFEGFTLVGNKYSTCIRGSWDTNRPVCVNSQCSTFPTPDHALVASKYNGAILMYFCEPGYILIGNSEIYCNGKQWNGTVPHCRDTTAMAPTKCDFENADLCWWEQDPHHDFDWRRHNFETPSSHIGTGPTYDHTLGEGNDGYYLYIEASGRLVNDTARIISPLYNASLTNHGCFSFWYHMYGATIGSLRIYMKSELKIYSQVLLFEKHGNQGNHWIHGLVNLPKSNVSFQLIIEGTRGSSYVSDLAVDDVAIIQGDECNIIRKSETSIIISSTISSFDQIEIVNAKQSCRGRCNITSETDIRTTSVWQMFHDVCHCSIDCAEYSRCCPDFSEYCIFAVNDNAYSLSPTEEIDIGDLSHVYNHSARESHNNSEVIMIPLGSKDDIEPYGTKSPSKISTIKNVTTIKSTKTQRKKLKYPVTSVTKMLSGKIIYAETPFITDDKLQVSVGSTETLSVTNQKSSTETQVVVEYVQKLHNVATFNVTEITCIIAILIICIIIGVVSITVALKRKKSYKRGVGNCNGSIFSEDSDVRFLTSDELLDFNLARPNDYDEL